MRSQVETHKQPGNAFILARNWDRFGGRIHEILNGLYVARRTGCEFKFTWPPEHSGSGVASLLPLVSQRLRIDHEIESESASSFEQVWITLDGTISLEEFKSITGSLDQSQCIVLGNFFSIPRFRGDKKEHVLKEWSEIGHELWDEDLLPTLKFYKDNFSKDSVIHGRFGDLVFGDWRNFVDPEKYVTALQIRRCLEDKTFQDLSVTLVSDSPSITNVLTPSIEEEVSLAPSWPKHLPLSSKSMIQDLFRLQAAVEVLAPPQSAFSALGAHLGGKTVTPLKRQPAETSDLWELTMETTNLWPTSPSDRWGAFISRDVDQYVNSLSGIQNTELFLKVAKISSTSDPTNVTALNHLAIGFSIIGDFSKSRRTLKKAMSVAKKFARVHDDPLFHTFVSELCVFGLQAVFPSTNTSLIHLRKRVIHNRCMKTLKKLKKLNPFQISHVVSDLAEEFVRLLASSPFVKSQPATKAPIKTPVLDFGPNPDSLFVVNVLAALKRKLQ